MSPCGDSRAMRVVLIMARTLDGRTARGAGDPVDWTGAADKAHFAALTRRIGLVFMGARTFEAMGQPLPGRRNVVFTRSVADDGASTENLVFTSDPVERVLERHAAMGYREAALIGGASLNGAFARCGCIDELFVTLSPLFFGQGPGLFTEGVAMGLSLVSVSPLGPDSLLAHYRVTG